MTTRNTALALCLFLLCSIAATAWAQEPPVEASDVAIRLEAMTSGEAGKADAARHSLVEMGPAALPHLLGPLADGKLDYELRASVAWVLGELGDPRATDPLRAVWAKPGPGYFKMQVAIALASLGDPVELRSFVSPTAKDKILVAKAAIGLANIQDTASIEPLRTFVDDDTIGTFVALALARLGFDPGKARLRKLLTTKMFRNQAALGLARLGDTGVIFQLRFCLGDDDPFVRREAARFLGKLRDLDSGSKLHALATGDRDPRVRAAAARAAKAIDIARRAP